MTTTLTVLLDTNILERNAHSITYEYQTTRPATWGDIPITAVRAHTARDPILPQSHEREHFAEAQLLSRVAEFERASILRLYRSMLAQLEYLNHTTPTRAEHWIPSESLHSLPIEAPLTIQIAPPTPTAETVSSVVEIQLLHISDPRFQTIIQQLRAAEAARHRVQHLIDACFLWLAEINSLDFFLTLDIRFAKRILDANRRGFSTPVRVVKPSELISAIG